MGRILPRSVALLSSRRAWLNVAVLVVLCAASGAVVDGPSATAAEDGTAAVGEVVRDGVGNVAANVGGHAHVDAFAVETPRSAAHALRVIERRLHPLDDAVRYAQLRHAAVDAHAIARVAGELPRLAKADASLAAKLPEIALAARAVAMLADALREAAMRGDLIDSLNRAANLREMVDELAARIPYAYRFDLINPPAVIQPGVVTTLRFQLHSPSGEPANLLTQHGAPLHLVIFFGDLSWFAHTTPKPLGEDRYELTITFPAPGKYTLFADFTSALPAMVENPQAAVIENHIIPIVLTVPGPPMSSIPMRPDTDEAKRIDGYRVLLQCNGDGFESRRASLIRYSILHANFKPVTDLELFLNEPGHLLIASQDLSHFIHAHPLSREEAAALAAAPAAASNEGNAPAAAPLLANARETDVIFPVTFPAPGLYKAFARFQHRGEIVLVPFTIDVRPGESFAILQHSDHGVSTPNAPGEAGTQPPATP